MTQDGQEDLRLPALAGRERDGCYRRTAVVDKALHARDVELAHGSLLLMAPCQVVAA